MIISLNQIQRRMGTLGSYGIRKWVCILEVFWLLSFAGQASALQGKLVPFDRGRIIKGSLFGMETEEKQSIGFARMEEDGTIVLELRAEGPGGITGDALLRYPPGHPEYNNILRHLGGLKKGEVKQVPPWPQR